MRVLIITGVFPESTSSGSGARLMEWLHLFHAQHWQLHLASTAEPSQHSDAPEKLGATIHSIRVNDPSFDVLIQDMQPDIVLFDRFNMEEQFGWRVEKHCPHALRLLETIDLHCLRHARQQESKQSQAVCLKPSQQALYNEVAKREIASIWRCDLSIMISDAEIDILQRDFHIPASLLHHCPFMLNRAPSPQNMPTFHERQHMMTIGNFRHAPNWDAVLWLKQDIWPRIRQQLPQVELHIYGAYTPPKATALHNPKQGFHILGRAEDAFIVNQQARLCLAPLRFGAGIKTKLSDAMQVGTPSVTTSVGAEGMHGDLPWSGAIADDAESFAQAAIDLYQHQASWQQAQQHGFDILQQWFDCPRHQKALIQRIQQLQSDPETHRQQHFIGSMLRHHHHRSTEFMSRWIEEKNKPRHEN